MKSKKYDGCFISFVDARFDARLQNLIHSLSKKYNHLCILQLTDTDERFFLDKCQIISLKINPKWRGFKKFLLSYLILSPKAFSIKADFYCAEDVFSLPVASLVSLIRKSKLYYDSRELYFAIGALANKRFKQWIWTLIETWFIKTAVVFSTGDKDSQLLKQRYQIPLPPTVYNYPLLKNIAQNSSLRETLNLSKGHVILLYQGMIAEGRGIQIMIELIKQLPKNYVLVLIGDGVILNQLRSDAKKTELSDRVFFIGAVPYQSLLSYTASADIGLSLIEPITKSYELALPNKLFEYIMCLLPVVVSNLPAMKNIIDEYHVGKATELNIPDIIKTILEVHANLNQYKEACALAKTKLNWDAQEEKILQLFS